MSRRLLSPMPQSIVDSQRRASDPDRSVWVTANAGSGKTYVLTARVLRLLLAGCKPEEILCLTYTKAAAAEMRGRVGERLGRWALASEAELDAISGGLTSRREAVASRGVDIEALDDEIAADNARAKTLGLTFSNPNRKEVANADLVDPRQSE